MLSLNVRLRCPQIAPNVLRLDAGGGIAKARTRENDDVTYPLSAENTPPLA